MRASKRRGGVTDVGLLFCAALALTAVACAPRYTVVGRESPSAVLSGNCRVRLLDQAPDTGLTILGEVKPEDPSKLTSDADAFLGQVREQVCRLTGDAVIVNRNEAGQYLSGTIVRLR
jgi:hypothetical protein